MPFVNVKLSKKLAPEAKTELKADLGNAIALFPGKSESWLMCNIEDEKDMFFQGKAGDCAFVEVKLFGSVSESASDRFTAEMCRLMGNFGIPANRVYVRYEGGDLWGWNGSNF